MKITIPGKKFDVNNFFKKILTPVGTAKIEQNTAQIFFFESPAPGARIPQIFAETAKFFELSK